MSKKSDFIIYLNDNYFNVNKNIPENIMAYWTAFCGQTAGEKPAFTDNGKMVLKYMIENSDRDMMKAKDIAEGLVVSSKTVSGAMRKLVTDGYVEKVGQDPVVYSLTEKGKNIKFDEGEM
jgi:predicted transcriptional regulator